MQHKAGLSWEPYRALLSPGPLQLPSWILLSRARSLSPPSPLPRTEQSVRWSKASGFRSDPEPSLPPEPCELSRHKTCTRQGSGLARGALFSRTDGCPILHAGPQQGTVSSAQRPAGTEGGKRELKPLSPLAVLEPAAVSLTPPLLARSTVTSRLVFRVNRLSSQWCLGGLPPALQAARCVHRCAFTMRSLLGCLLLGFTIPSLPTNFSQRPRWVCLNQGTHWRSAWRTADPLRV